MIVKVMIMVRLKTLSYIKVIVVIIDDIKSDDNGELKT